MLQSELAKRENISLASSVVPQARALPHRRGTLQSDHACAPLAGASPPRGNGPTIASRRAGSRSLLSEHVARAVRQFQLSPSLASLHPRGRMTGNPSVRNLRFATRGSALPTIRSESANPLCTDEQPKYV